MRFLGTISHRADIGTPPPALLEAMGGFMERAMAAGVVADTGGLERAGGTRFELREGTVSVVDGPFAESREVVGGFVVYQVSSREEAVDWTRQFVELHHRYWPEFEGSCEVLKIEG